MRQAGGVVAGIETVRVKQIVHSLRNGSIEVLEAPCPAGRPGHVLIRTSRTLISAGTERMLMDFGKANLVSKALQQPDRVRQVLDKIRTDGLITTLEAVFDKLDNPLALGYCNVGMVADSTGGPSGLSVGARVVSNGRHAEIVSVPANLCARIPDGVSDDSAAFTAVAAIGLQGIRLAQPTIGESVAVIGLGLIGLIAVQLLRANGCRVLGIDFDAERLALAARFGAEVVNIADQEDPLLAAQSFSRGRGVDAVLICASTKSSEPVHQAASMSRKRGRIVLVGVTGLELRRTDFYEKELSFQVSCSYGPGRYDPSYEENGVDYPVGFVRWTEQRNFEAVLDMMADGRLDVVPLITHRFPLERAREAYEVLGGGTRSMGIMLDYPRRDHADLLERSVPLTARTNRAGNLRVSVIGAGNYAGRVLIPAFRAAGARLHALGSNSGLTSVHVGRKHEFAIATTDIDALLDDHSIDIVSIATRHDSHAQLVVRALKSGKHVFVEKPLALTDRELAEIDGAYRAATSDGRGPLLMVGFNRRFAPLVRVMKRLLDSLHLPKVFVVTINAGEIGPEHWTQDRSAGGGRIIGEACHFVDLLRFLVGAPIKGAHVTAMNRSGAVAIGDDKVSFTLSFADSSFGTVHYLANGHKGFPKERIEVFCAGRVLQLDNFRSLRGWGWPGFRTRRNWRQDKGQHACVAEFIAAIRTGQPMPIPYEELAEVSRWTLRIAEKAAR